MQKSVWESMRPALLGLALCVACGGTEEPQPGAPEPREPAAEAPAAAGPEPGAELASAEAQQIFSTRCTTCHGPTGAGDGPGSTALVPKPRNFQDDDWQASVTDEHIETIIQYGGTAVGKSPMMPGNPDLMSKPEVVAALRAHVRGLGGR